MAVSRRLALPADNQDADIRVLDQQLTSPTKRMAEGHTVNPYFEMEMGRPDGATNVNHHRVQDDTENYTHRNSAYRPEDRVSRTNTDAASIASNQKSHRKSKLKVLIVISILVLAIAAIVVMVIIIETKRRIDEGCHQTKEVRVGNHAETTCLYSLETVKNVTYIEVNDPKSSLLLKEPIRINITMDGSITSINGTIGSWFISVRVLENETVLFNFSRKNITCSAQGSYSVFYKDETNNLITEHDIQINIQSYIGNPKVLPSLAETEYEEGTVIDIVCTLNTECEMTSVTSDVLFKDKTTINQPGMTECTYVQDENENGRIQCINSFPVDLWKYIDSVNCQTVHESKKKHETIKYKDIDTEEVPCPRDHAFNIESSAIFSCRKKKSQFADYVNISMIREYSDNDEKIFIGTLNQGKDISLDDDRIQVNFTVIDKTVDINVSISEIYCKDAGAWIFTFLDGKNITFNIAVNGTDYKEETYIKSPAKGLVEDEEAKITFTTVLGCNPQNISVNNSPEATSTVKARDTRNGTVIVTTVYEYEELNMSFNGTVLMNEVEFHQVNTGEERSITEKFHVLIIPRDYCQNSTSGCNIYHPYYEHRYIGCDDSGMPVERVCASDLKFQQHDCEGSCNYTRLTTD